MARSQPELLFGLPKTPLSMPWLQITFICKLKQPKTWPTHYIQPWILLLAQHLCDFLFFCFHMLWDVIFICSNNCYDVPGQSLAKDLVLELHSNRTTSPRSRQEAWVGPAGQQPAATQEQNRSSKAAGQQAQGLSKKFAFDQQASSQQPGLGKKLAFEQQANSQQSHSSRTPAAQQQDNKPKVKFGQV